MRNIEKLANCIAKYGIENVIVHTIPSSKNWIICQKIEPNKWSLTLANPMGDTAFDIGSITNAQHLGLWQEIIKVEIAKKASYIVKSKEIIRYPEIKKAK